MLTREQKREQVAELSEKLQRANCLYLADYRGVDVESVNELRTRIHREGEGEYEYRVAKNTLLKRAVEGSDFAKLSDQLTGPTAVALSFGDPAGLARILTDFAKECEVFEVRAGVVEGELVDLESIRKLAALPGKQELRGMLAGTVQAPLRNLAGTLHALLGHVRNALEQRQQQLEAE